MISTEWGHPRSFAPGFNPKDVAEGNYGTHINVFDWKKGKLLQVRNSIENTILDYTPLNEFYISSLSAYSVSI